MARRIVRTTSALQPFQWERFNTRLILDRIAEIRTVKDGRCTFNASPYHFWLPVLHTAVRAVTPEAARLKQKCISASLSDASVTLKDTNAFLARCAEQFNILVKRPKSKFLLYTSITYSGSKLLDWIAQGDVRIYWGPSSDASLLKKIRKAQKTLDPLRRAHKLPSDEALTPMLVRVLAYDPTDAFEEANDFIDRFRGLLNLLINSAAAVNPFAGLGQPHHAFNQFRRGPFHSIHRPDGSLATETIWYEHRWLHEMPSVTFKDIPDYRRALQKWWRRLQRNPMRDFVSDALLRYCRALDLHEPDASLLGLWQVLETLTGTDKYDELIDRLIRLFKDPDDAREVMKHLRLRRNQTVHAAADISREANAILVQAESMASQALFFYLQHAGKFANLEEIHAFMDLPLDHKRVQRQQQIADLFLTYQSRPLLSE